MNPESVNWHDSGVESLKLDSMNRVLTLTIELCNWMQPNYLTGDPETQTVVLRFIDLDKLPNIDAMLEAIDDNIVLGQILELSIQGEEPKVVSSLIMVYTIGHEPKYYSLDFLCSSVELIQDT